jgi:hypothetical protein
MWASRFEAAQTNTAAWFRLQTVAASVVGGVNMLGQRYCDGVLLNHPAVRYHSERPDPGADLAFLAAGCPGLLILLAVIVDC